jgi:lipopolysaccharide export LptBFGC system permease protein LptF
VAALVSAVPELAQQFVPLGLAFVTILAVGNLRGVRESGALFAAPT